MRWRGAEWPRKRRCPGWNTSRGTLRRPPSKVERQAQRVLPHKVDAKRRRRLQGSIGFCELRANLLVGAGWGVPKLRKSLLVRCRHALVVGAKGAQRVAHAWSLAKELVLDGNGEHAARDAAEILKRRAPGSKAW